MVMVPGGKMAFRDSNGQGKSLLPQHLADLRKSGVSDATIHENGLHSPNTSGHVRIILRWDRYDGRLGPCLAFPFRDMDGKLLDYVRLKPDRPRKNKGDGKPIKYESPKGAGNQPYFPVGTLPALKDPTRPLLITEGEKKALKADQEGFPCIGLVGVYGWCKPRPKDSMGKGTGSLELIDPLTQIAWQDRPVYIVFDSDAVDNPGVRKAEHRLANVLLASGAAVRIVRLPPGPVEAGAKPAKVGLDDFLVAHDSGELQKLLESATVLAKTAEESPCFDGKSKPLNGGARMPFEQDDDPHRLARVFLWGHTNDLLRASPDMPNSHIKYRYWQEEWWRWYGPEYRRVPAKEIRAMVTQAIKEEFNRLHHEEMQSYVQNKMARARGAVEGDKGENDKGPPLVRKVTTGITNNTVHALEGISLLQGAVEPPSWISGEGAFPARELLITPNQLFHIPSLVDGAEHFSCSPTLNLFCLQTLDYPFDLNAPKPEAWFEFLAQLWPKDQASIATLQEWMGYFLTSDTRQQKILMLVGPKRSGKGTLMRVIAAMLGKGNVAAPTLSSLATNFGLWPLIGKTAAFISDARLSKRTDTAVVTERLLSISGEDPITVDRKNLSPVTLKLSVRFIVATNELPRLADASGALTGRIVLLRLSESWYGKENIGLTDKLLKELPGILLWAIAGWKRLRERGHFMQPASGNDLLGEMEDLSSPVAAFVRECCFVGPGYRAAIGDLFSRWKTWCERKGRTQPGYENTLGRDLLAAVSGLSRCRPTDGDGERYRGYNGIALRPL
jgi:putative DNA primase/helicase